MSDTSNSSDDELSEERKYVRIDLGSQVSNAAQFKMRFRLTPRLVDLLESILADHLSSKTKRSMPIEPKQKILITLRFLASNGVFHEVGDAHGNRILAHPT